MTTATLTHDISLSSAQEDTHMTPDTFAPVALRTDDPTALTLIQDVTDPAWCAAADRLWRGTQRTPWQLALRQMRRERDIAQRRAAMMVREVAA